MDFFAGQVEDSYEGIIVPQAVYSKGLARHDQRPYINFRVNGRLGISVSAVLRSNFEGLENADRNYSLSPSNQTKLRMFVSGIRVVLRGCQQTADGYAVAGLQRHGEDTVESPAAHHYRHRASRGEESQGVTDSVYLI